MITLKQLKMAARRCACGLSLSAAVLLSGCFSYHDNPFGSISLVSHPAAAGPLQKGDLAGAARILEPRLAARPQDAELSYTLGCVYLMQSDDATDRATRRSLRERGWRLVEAASGKERHADALLAHAYLVGRWGKKRSASLETTHTRLRLASPTPPAAEQRDASRRVWVVLSPP